MRRRSEGVVVVDVVSGGGDRVVVDKGQQNVPFLKKGNAWCSRVRGWGKRENE